MGSNEGQPPTPIRRAGGWAQVHLAGAPTMGGEDDLSYHFKELLETKCGLTCWSEKLGTPNSQGFAVSSKFLSTSLLQRVLSRKEAKSPLLRAGTEEGIRCFSLKSTESTPHADPSLIWNKSLKKKTGTTQRSINKELIKWIKCSVLMQCNVLHTLKCLVL